MKWMIDASFAVHPDFKSHTGGTLSFGGGAAQVMSKKQKLNSRSSTKAELIAVDDVVTMILWTKLFMEWQGYPIEKNILYQDNKSAILLEENGGKSAGKRSQAINIRYFFIRDQVEKGNVKIKYCPTDNMIADFMTKPLQGVCWDMTKYEFLRSKKKLFKYKVFDMYDRTLITMILWTKLFMEWQGYPIKKNILYQDNKIAILLEENGRKSTGKRGRAINIRYFFITDQVEKGNVKIKYCLTDDMIADFMTKPLQGEKFCKFRDLILDPQDQVRQKLFKYEVLNAILLEENGCKRAGKRSQAINIRYYFITDQVEKGKVKIKYCPTDNMIADFMTKPLQDVFKYQTGAVITQDSKPIAFYSRKLQDGQHNYTTTEHELLAIVETLKEFRTIPLGHKIKVYTDHKNLTFTQFNTEHVLRWGMVLEEYGPEHIYIKGPDNVVADALSRLVLIDEEDEDSSPSSPTLKIMAHNDGKRSSKLSIPKTKNAFKADDVILNDYMNICRDKLPDNIYPLSMSLISAEQ
ncbi:unnamed protein product [Cylindrotheca closterium]|uniref:Reverse transcriptase RNase H-like domain-containing protein n=1 Tax=Cylindrotheca closterium TaxID=2856 RepID=A0AAD2CW11_9STRA|nr:unnamed protein product [Cylindrotheca closterium]